MQSSHHAPALDGTVNVSVAESPSTIGAACAKPERTPSVPDHAVAAPPRSNCGLQAPSSPNPEQTSLDAKDTDTPPLHQDQDLDEAEDINEGPIPSSCAPLTSPTSSLDPSGTGPGTSGTGLGTPGTGLGISGTGLGISGTGLGFSGISQCLSLKDRGGQGGDGARLLMTTPVTSSSTRVVESETPIADDQATIKGGSAPIGDGVPREGNDESGREPAPAPAGADPERRPEPGSGTEGATAATVDDNEATANETVDGEPSTSSRTPDRSQDRPPVWPKRTMEYWDLERFLPLVVSERFKMAVEAWKPSLVADPALWQLFVYLCFGSYTHRESGHLQLPIQLLAAFAGALTPGVVSRQTSRRGTRLIKEMQRELGKDESGEHRFSWHVARSGKNPRMLRRLNLPDEIAGLVEEERRLGPAVGTIAIGPMVLAVRDASGALLSDSTRARAARERRAEARARGRRSVANYGPSRDVLDHLNGLPSNAFTATVKGNLGAAFAAVDEAYARKVCDAAALPGWRCAERIKRLDRARDAQRNALRELSYSAKPRYVSSPNSARLFPSESHHPADLWSEVRRAATAPWVELDLEAAYFGSAPRIFDVPLLEDFLASGACVWDVLVDDLGLGPLLDAFPERRDGVWSALKRVLKREGVYPSMTGRRRGDASRRVTEKMPLAAAGAVQVVGADAGESAARLVPMDVGERFVKHPLMVDLYAARTAFAERALSQGYVFDHVGRKVALPGYDGAADHALAPSRRRRKRRRASVVGTLTSYLFSLIEMDLMKAVLDLEREQRSARYRTMLWQHDGASIMLRGAGRLCSACTVAQVQSAVDVEAGRLGVYTRLRVDHDAEGLSLVRDTCRRCARRTKRS